MTTTAPRPKPMTQEQYIAERARQKRAAAAFEAKQTLAESEYDALERACIREHGGG